MSFGSRISSIFLEMTFDRTQKSSAYSYFMHENSKHSTMSFFSFNFSIIIVFFFF